MIKEKAMALRQAIADELGIEADIEFIIHTEDKQIGEQVANALANDFKLAAEFLSSGRYAWYAVRGDFPQTLRATVFVPYGEVQDGDCGGTAPTASVS